MSVNFSLDFPKAYGPLTASADFRVQPEDFQVDEYLGYEPAGQGEHVYLHIRKRGENTAWVAEKIAELAQVAVMDVGYCGRKDRHAITTQWFSVYLPHVDKEPDWALLNSESIQLLRSARHSHKLRRGDHEENHFVIRLRDFCVDDKNKFEEKLKHVLQNGVPNYFGEQRFGHDGNNLVAAQALLVDGKRMRDKQKRGLYLSAARSYLFNQVVSARVLDGSWQTVLDGEPEHFSSAPLWGRGRSLASGDLDLLEKDVLADWASWCDGLEHAGLAQERRRLILLPKNTHWHWKEADLIVSFSLGSGEFATTVLAELAVLHFDGKTETTGV